jgi:hypothetical protein
MDREQVDAVVRAILADPSRAVRFAGFKIIQRVVRDKGLLLSYLDIGLEKLDENDAAALLPAIAHGIGFKKLLDRLQEIAIQTPQQVICAWYQLVPLVRQTDPKLLPSLVRIQAVVDAQVATADFELRDFWGRVKRSVPLS